MAYDEMFDSPAAASAFSGPDSWARLLLHLVDGCLAGSLFVVPFLLGGRMAVGQFLLVLFAVGAALAWAIRQLSRPQATWRRSGAEFLLLAGAGLLVLQLVPLPQTVLAYLAPHTSTLLPLWTEETAASLHLGPWSRISLTPAATQAGLILFLAYSLLFLITVQRIRTVDDVERLLRWSALAAVAMAFFGLVQYFTSNGKFFWFYEHPFTHTAKFVKGGFTNRNHFAHFLALGVGPLIWWIQHAYRHQRTHRRSRFAFSTRDASFFGSPASFLVLALGIVLFAVLLSLSRGGALATFLAVAIGIAVGYRAGSLGLRFTAGLAGVALLIAVALAIYGHQQVSERLDDLAAGSIQALDAGQARRTIWNTTLKAIPNFLIAGSGQGSLRYVYPMYLPWIESNHYFTHAENGYLQVALENGLPGLLLLLAGIGLCGFWCAGSLRSAASKRVVLCAGAVSASLAVSAAHSLVDFVWYAPGCMAVVVILAACACRLWHFAREERGKYAHRVALPRLVGLAATAILLVGGLWMLGDRLGSVRAEPHWFRYLIMQRNSLDAIPFSQEEQIDAQEEWETALTLDQKAVHELEEVVRSDANHAEAHLELAGAYMRLFDRIQATSPLNAMPLGQISDAAMASQFPSRDALQQWLSAAVGDHVKYLELALWHARRGLALCPLEGEGYLYLGELCFLEGAQATVKSAYLTQAMKVRPYHGTVLFYAGQAAAIAGQYEQALAYWKQSYDCGRPYQRRLIESYVGRTHPDHLGEEIELFLETFQPDLPALRLLYRRYQPIARPEQLVPLQVAYAQAAEAEAAREEKTPAATLWLEAMGLYGEAGLSDRELACAYQAVRADGSSFRAHYALGHCLADRQQYVEAEEHLRWCLHRKPNHPRVEAKLREVVQYRHLQEGRSAALPMEGAPRR